MSRAEIVDRFAALPRYRQFQALRMACDAAIEVWRELRNDGIPIEYTDSIVGQHHVVDDALPARALDEVDRWLAGEPVDAGRTEHDYLEPSVALGDGDLELPAYAVAAYTAIRALHGNVFSTFGRASQLAVLNHVVDALAVDPEAWIAEWWTRVWDAWASTPELPYPESPLTRAGFRALSAWDLDGALATIEGRDGASACLRAIVLVLSGREHAALEGLATSFGIDDDDTLAWLDRQLFALVPEAIAASPGREHVAIICGERVEVHDRRGALVHHAVLAGGRARRVRFSADGNALWIAGDRIDAIGASGTFWHADVLGDRDAGTRDELQGARTLLALGGAGELVARDARGARLLAPVRALADPAVVGAAFSDEGGLVTHDGETITAWNPATVTPHGTARVARGIARIAYARGAVLVTHPDGSASLVRPGHRIHG